MTMMDDYMDKNVDQYCTFEANQFANQSIDQSYMRPTVTEMTLGGPLIPQVKSADETDDNFFHCNWEN